MKQFFPYNLGNSGQSAAVLFRQEAERLKELGSHPQIPGLLDYFEQDGNQFIVQQFINGPNLEEELGLEGPLSERQIQDLLKDILPVLEFIHSHHVIHRNIKPANIIRQRVDGQLILVDFGASKYSSETVMAKTGTLIGSPAYTAPEQVMGKAQFSSDLYSLGVTCLHLLTQIQPFELIDHAEGTWVWRDYLTNSVSQQLGRVLDKLLERGTRKRYQFAAEVLQNLAPMQPSASVPDDMVEGEKKSPGKLRSKIVAVSLAGIVGCVTLAGIGVGVNRFFPLGKQPDLIHALQPQVQPRQDPVLRRVPSSQKSQQQAEKDEELKTWVALFNLVRSTALFFGSSSILLGGVRAMRAHAIGEDYSPGLTLVMSGVTTIIVFNIVLSTLGLGNILDTSTSAALTLRHELRN